MHHPDPNSPPHSFANESSRLSLSLSLCSSPSAQIAISAIWLGQFGWAAEASLSWIEFKRVKSDQSVCHFLRHRLESAKSAIDWNTKMIAANLASDLFCRFHVVEKSKVIDANWAQIWPANLQKVPFQSQTNCLTDWSDATRKLEGGSSGKRCKK